MQPMFMNNSVHSTIIATFILAVVGLGLHAVIQLLGYEQFGLGGKEYQFVVIIGAFTLIMAIVGLIALALYIRETLTTRTK